MGTIPTRQSQHRLACLILLGGMGLPSLIMLAVQRATAGNSTPVPPLVAGVDLNTAAWPELAELPGIGPVLAKRICEFRAGRAVQTPGQPAFAQLRDLASVRGIGPETLARLRPFVRHPPD
jgi:competence protein ComEA